jgi:hypothetical protein
VRIKSSFLILVEGTVKDDQGGYEFLHESVGGKPRNNIIWILFTHPNYQMPGLLFKLRMKLKRRSRGWQW